MSTSEIVELWCVVSYAIAAAVFVRRYTRDDVKKIDEQDMGAVCLAPVVVPLCIVGVAIVSPLLWLVVKSKKRQLAKLQRLAKLRGENEAKAKGLKAIRVRYPGQFPCGISQFAWELEIDGAGWCRSVVSNYRTKREAIGKVHKFANRLGISMESVEVME